MPGLKDKFQTVFNDDKMANMAQQIFDVATKEGSKNMTDAFELIYTIRESDEGQANFGAIGKGNKAEGGGFKLLNKKEEENNGLDLYDDTDVTEKKSLAEVTGTVKDQDELKKEEEARKILRSESGALSDYVQ